MAYPATITSMTPTAGTQTLGTVDHNNIHNTFGSATIAIETVLGTTAGTSVLKNFNAGDFASRINSSNVLQQIISGTINNSVIGTPSLTGGTVSPSAFSVNIGTIGTVVTNTINANGNSDISITSGTSSLVKVTGIRRDGTVNSYSNSEVLCYGWGFVTVPGTASDALNGTINFPINFSSAPVVLITKIGSRNATDPTIIGDFNSDVDMRQLQLFTQNVGTSSCIVGLYSFQTSTKFTNGNRLGYAWKAIGPK